MATVYISTTTIVYPLCSGQETFIINFVLPAYFDAYQMWLYQTMCSTGWKISRSVFTFYGDPFLFVCTKRFKIGIKMAELGPFFPWEVAGLYWEPNWTKEDPMVFVCTKKIHDQSRNGWLMAIFPLRGCMIPLRTTWDKRESFGVYSCQNIQNRSRNGWAMAILPREVA